RPNRRTVQVPRGGATISAWPLPALDPVWGVDSTGFEPVPPTFAERRAATYTTSPPPRATVGPRLSRCTNEKTSGTRHAARAEDHVQTQQREKTLPSVG